MLPDNPQLYILFLLAFRMFSNKPLGQHIPLSAHFTANSGNLVKLFFHLKFNFTRHSFRKRIKQCSQIDGLFILFEDRLLYWDPKCALFTVCFKKNGAFSLFS